MILSFVMTLFGYTLVSSIICVELDPGAHMRCIWFLSNTRCDSEEVCAGVTRVEEAVVTEEAGKWRGGQRGGAQAKRPTKGRRATKRCGGSTRLGAARRSLAAEDEQG
jgi:hypothetical protein